jgi:hypothetical protein
MAKLDFNKFLSEVRTLSSEVMNSINNQTCKNLIFQVIINGGYDVGEVYSCLEVWIKNKRPDLYQNYKKQDWVKTYQDFKKSVDNDVVVKLLDKKLEESKRRKGDKTYLEMQLFEIFNEKLQIDPETIRRDILFDRYGWKSILFTINNMDDGKVEPIEESKVELSEELIETPKVELSEELIETPKVELREEPIETHKVESIEEPKVEAPKQEKTKTIKVKTDGAKRRHGKFEYIKQLTLDGKLVKTYKRRKEILDENPTFKGTSISKCLYGDYKQAHGFKWVGVEK